MSKLDRTLQIIRLENPRQRLLASAAGLAILAAIGGYAIGQSSAPAPTAAVSAETPGEEHGPEGFVPMKPESLATNGVVVETVKPGSLAGEIIAQATVTAPPEGKALLTARADGAVVRINRRLGDAIGAGETVALLESREAAAFIADRNASAARAQAARAAAAREQRLYSAKITAKQDLEAAIAAVRTAEADLHRADAAVTAAGVTGGRYLAVRSPISGRITEVDTQLGAYVAAGAELFNVSDPRRVQVEAAVPAADVQRVRPGDRAIVELANGATVDATVRSVTPALDPTSRAATVVLQMGGTPAGIAQGQGVRVRITPQGTTTNGIILSEESVQQVEGRDVVFVQVKGGFQATPVTIGERSGGRIEILEGLKPGQIVVTQGAFVLKSQLGASEAEH